jgi:cellulose synthase operon protein YhjQ
MPLLCFASPKGGVGKTTLAANIARELARTGQRVVALDLDPQNALRLHFGVPLHEAEGLMPALGRHASWRSVLRQTESGVYLLPHGQVDMAGALALAEAIGRAPSLLARLVQDILDDGEVTLVVDMPPGPSTVLSAVLPFTDILITVLLADATSVALIPAVEQGRMYGPGIGAAAGDGGARLGFVLNQFDARSRLSRTITEAARRHLGDRLFGLVYRDENVAEAIAAQRSVSEFAPASKAARDIAALGIVLASRLAAIWPAVPVADYGGWQS